MPKRRRPNPGFPECPSCCVRNDAWRLPIAVQALGFTCSRCGYSWLRAMPAPPRELVFLEADEDRDQSLDAPTPVTTPWTDAGRFPRSRE